MDETDVTLPPSGSVDTKSNTSRSNLIILDVAPEPMSEPVDETPQIRNPNNPDERPDVPAPAPEKPIERVIDEATIAGARSLQDADPDSGFKIPEELLEASKKDVRVSDALAAGAVLSRDIKEGTTAEKERAVGIILDHLTQSLSKSHLDNQRRFNRSYPQESLDENQRWMINMIVKNTTPEQLADIIFNYPPGVFNKTPDGVVLLRPKLDIIPPSESEVAAAKTEIVNPDPTKPEMFEGLQKQIKKYLLAPRVKDGFADHYTERTQWEASFEETLRLLDLQAEDPKRQRVTTFIAKWSDNKYATNKIAGTLGYLTGVESTLPSDSPLRKELESVYSNMERAINKEKVNHDLRVEKIVAEHKRIITLFSPTN